MAKPRTKPRLKSRPKNPELKPRSFDLSPSQIINILLALERLWDCFNKLKNS